MKSKFQKVPPRPDRVRQVPRQFSWLDHRLVRERRIQGCSPCSLALYLLLVTVSDEQGLSYYSDATAGALLSLETGQVGVARRELERAGLIAYEAPVYQVLPLDRGSAPVATARTGETLSMAEALQRLVLKGTQP